MDALEALVCSGTAKGRKSPRTVINVLVDYEALLRGHTTTGETCEIAGIGSLPVSVVTSWQRDAYLSLIVTHGIDIKAVTRATRYVDVDQRRALSVRDRSCVIQQCDAVSRLHRDHRVPFARGGPSAIDNLQQIRERLAQSGEAYWAEQVEIQRRGATAWLAFAEGRADDAATEMRTARMTRAEEKAARLPALLTIPMIVFILPTLFIVLLGPAAINVMDTFSKH